MPGLQILAGLQLAPQEAIVDEVDGLWRTAGHHGGIRGVPAIDEGVFDV